MRSRPRHIYMTRPRVPFHVWYSAEQRRRYQKDICILASWLAMVYWRKIPEKRASEIIMLLTRKIELRHDAFHHYPGDKSSGTWVFTHCPSDWDERNWRFLRKLYAEIKSYRKKREDELT